MKAKYIILFLISSFLISCKKTELRTDRPDEKLNKLRSDYIEQLSSAKNGWIGYLFPQGGKGFTFKFEFNNKNRVLSYSAMDERKSLQPMESSYRIAADQVLSLYFDTYSYLHILADPNEFVNGGFRGAGLISDFEFSILEFKKDTIKLKGNHNSSEFILIRANEDQGKEYINQAFKLNNSLEKLNQFPHYFNKFNFENQDIQFAINNILNTISFYYDENGFKQYTTEYAVTNSGILLRKPFIIKGKIINELFDFNLDPKTAKGNFKIEKDRTVEIINSSKPVIIDTDAPRRMYINRYNYSSYFGFYINGRPDGLQMQRLPDYTGTFFIPRRYLDPLDALYFTFRKGDAFVGPLFNSTYDLDGKIVFKEFMAITGFDPGAENLNLLHEFNKVWFDKNGFYIYQTGTNYYDAVSTVDSRIWIRFN